jgi:hypothetical protein
MIGWIVNVDASKTQGNTPECLWMCDSVFNIMKSTISTRMTEYSYSDTNNTVLQSHLRHHEN